MEFKRLKRELLYKGNIIELHKELIQVPNGNLAHWDFIHHKGAAAVIPVTKEGKILMVRQYRSSLDGASLEIPAGGLDSADEPAIDCAFRELEEETGYRTEQLEFLLTLYTTVAYSDEKIDIFVTNQLIPSKQNLDEDEFIQVEAYSLSEIIKMIFDGTIVDAKTIAAILAYQNQYRKDREM